MGHPASARRPISSPTRSYPSELGEPPGSPRRVHRSAFADGRCAGQLGEPPGSPRPPPLVHFRGRGLCRSAGGTSRLPQTPSTGPLSRTDATRLPVPAREEAEEREHEDYDEDDPEDAHGLVPPFWLGLSICLR